MLNFVALLCVLVCASFACERDHKNECVICCQRNTTFIVEGRNVSFMAYRQSLCGVWVQASGDPGIKFSIIPFVIALVVGVP